MTQRQFDNMMSAKKLSATRKGLDAILKKADNIIQALDPFTFKKFSEKWHGTKQQKNNLATGFTTTINRLKSENRIGTALSYRDAMNSIINYSGSAIRYTDINSTWLKGYENHMLSFGKSITTVSIYLRALRVILRSEGRSFLKSNPFDGYLIPSGNNRKNEALTIRQVKKLSQYRSKNPTKQMALDFWLFSYNCGGANYEDIFRLKWQNINFKQNFLSFFRRKTQRTRKTDVRPIIVPLTQRMIETIEKYGSESDSNGYVFSILNADMPEERKKLRVKYVTKNFNKHTKNIGEELKLDIKLTSTVARHSRASIMNFQGQHYSIISEMLGHSSISTTENYLKSFPVKAQLQAMSKSEV